MKTLYKNKIITLIVLALISFLCFVCAGGVTSARADGVKPTMVEGASVRLKDEGVSDGIRFTMQMTAGDFESIYTDSTFKSGIVVLPTAMSGSDDLTVNTDDVAIADTSNAWFKVGNENVYDYACNAAVVGMGRTNYGTALSARGYVYTDSIGYVYTDYDADDNSRSMVDVATAAIENTDDFAELQSLYSYLSKGDISSTSGYIYQANGIYTLPTFGSATPDYTVSCDETAITVLNGNKIDLDTAGEYTATFGANTIDFTVYSQADYANVIAPLNSTQYDAQLAASDPNLIEMEYDSTMEAYELTLKGAGGGIKVVAGSELTSKINAGATGDKYFAFDIYLGNDYTTSSNMWFMFNNFAGTLSAANARQTFADHQASSVYIYPAESAKRITSFTTMTVGGWYKIFVEFNGLTSSAMNKDLINFRATGTCYIKNMRFTDTATNPQPVDPNLIAKCDSSADISLFMANSTTLTYDSTMNAMKSVSVAAGASVKAIKDGDVQTKLTDAIGAGKYFSFEIYFADGFTSATSNIWFYLQNFAGTIGSGGNQQIANHLNSSIFIYDNDSGVRLTSNSMTTGKWYTFFVQFNGLTSTANNKDLFLLRGYGTCYIKNMRLSATNTLA